MTLRAAVACAAALAHLAGCAGSGREPYPNDLATKNLSVRSALSGVRAALHVYGVNAQCRTRYLGTLELDRPALAVGIAPDRWSYLVIDFASSSFLGGRQGRVSRGLLLMPRAKHGYELEATYRDDVHDVVLRERPPHGAARELPRLDLASCTPR